jgi:hypothetical protein
MARRSPAFLEQLAVQLVEPLALAVQPGALGADVLW